MTVEDLRGQALAALAPVVNPFVLLPVVARLEGTDLVPLSNATPQTWKSPFVVQICGDASGGHDLHDGDLAGIDPAGGLEAGKLYLIRWNRQHALSAPRMVGARLVFSTDAGEASLGFEGFEVLGRVAWHMRRM